MPSTFGLSSSLPLPKGSGQLDILYRGFATEKYCTYGRGKHETRKGHALKSGTAYFVQTPEGIQQMGPVCAAKIGKQKLHEVADLTREAISSHKDENEREFQSGSIIKPPALFDAKQFEEQERAKDIAYLMLRGEVLPGVKAREMKWRNKKLRASDLEEDMPLILLYREYQKDRTIPLGEVRRIREYAEREDEKNSHTRLLRCYLAHEQIERCLKSRRVDTAETYSLHDWDRLLAETRALPRDIVQKLNQITSRVAPGMPLSKEDGLPLIIAQATMFEGVSPPVDNRKLHVLLPRTNPAPVAVQRKLFG